jgi:hypothetical protein
MWHSRNSNIVSAMPTSCLLYLQWTKISKILLNKQFLSFRLPVSTSSLALLLHIEELLLLLHIVAEQNCLYSLLSFNSLSHFTICSTWMNDSDLASVSISFKYLLQVFSAFVSFSNLAIPFASFVFLLLLIHIQMLFWLFILSCMCWWGLRWHHVLFS